MKLLISIVHRDDVNRVMDALMAESVTALVEAVHSHSR